MNVNDLRYAIESSFCTCAQCDSRIDEWPEADASEPGRKVIYVSRDALFVGMCEKAHVNEFYLGEVKAEEYRAHDITERTVGWLVKQEECPHPRKVTFEIPAGDMATLLPRSR